MRKYAVILGLVFLFGAGCVPEPEGPGERIGRGVDDIMGGITDMNRDPNYGGPDDRSGRYDNNRYPDRPVDRTYDNRYPNDSYGRPRCDPLYDPKCDDPYWQDRKGADGRYDSEQDRRY